MEQLSLFEEKKPTARKKDIYAVPVQSNAAKIVQVCFLVCEFYKTNLGVLLHPSRKKEVVQYRNLAIWLSKKYITEVKNELVIPIRNLELCKFFNGIDHSTVYHSLNEVEWRFMYPSFRKEMEEFMIKYQTKLNNINND